MVTPSNSAYLTISDHHFAVVRQNTSTNQKAFFAQKAYKPGDLISSFSAGVIVQEPSYLTVQIGKDQHILLEPSHLQYINHSCDPNVFFDTDTFQIIALKDIAVGDEMSFFYPSTEWDMAQPFHCLCGSASCLGQIRGAAHLAREVIGKYRLTKFIQEQLHDRTKREERA